jgi:ribose-phosphate pyrophosphokinase
VNKIITLDLHNETIAGFFDIPFVHLSAVPIFIDYFKTKADFDLIVSPDVGGLKRATRFAQVLDLPLATINKKRDLATGKVKILGVNAKIEGRSVIIVDDFVSTGQTLMESAKFLKNKGVKSVSACLTHHFYISGVQEKIEQSALDMLYVTDTIQSPANRVKYKKLKVLSVAGLIAKNIRI